jgi:lipid A 3-O-deacylase
MCFSGRAFCSISVAAGLAMGMLCLAPTCQAGDFKLGAAGFRYGIGGNSSSADFNEGELFADWNLPWRWDLGHDVWLQMRLDSSVGWLGDPAKTGAIVTAGPGIRLGCEHFPLSLEAGSNPTILGEEHFAGKDFGSAIQFTTYCGVSLDLGAHVRLGYRYQHMSNAGLGDNNPGLNLNMFSLSFVF